MLLTLVRFGFSLSSNCILCLSDKEIEGFDPDGYKIFEREEETGFKATRYTYKENEKIEFKLDEKQISEIDTKEIFNKKIIKDLKFKQNNILSIEKVLDEITRKQEKKNI